MDKIIRIAITWLIFMDVILNHLSLRIRIKTKIYEETDAQQVILEAMKEIFSIRIFLSSVQMGVRILLMLLWIVYTIYDKDIVVICTLLAIGYSLGIYFSFQKIKESRLCKHMYEEAIKQVKNN